MFTRFRGGKGVATSAGVFLALAPVAALVALVVWVVLVAATRIVSLSSVAAAASLRLDSIRLTTAMLARATTNTIAPITVALLLSVFRFPSFLFQCLFESFPPMYVSSTSTVDPSPPILVSNEP